MSKTPQKIQDEINYSCGKSFWSSVNPLDTVDKDYRGKIIDKTANKFLNELTFLNRAEFSPYKKSLKKEFQIETYAFTVFTKWSIHFRDSYICGICGKHNNIDDPVHIDHIIPKSKFPCSHPWNLQSACENCNMDKSDRLLSYIPVLLSGAKFRSKKYFKEKWQIHQIFVHLDWIYNINNPLGNNESEQLENIKSYEKFFDHIIKMSHSWDKISTFLSLSR